MMRFSFPLLLILLLSLSLSSFSETMDGLVKREGIYYKKFSDVPFTGKVEGLVQGSFKDGKREGISLTYYGDGSAQLEQTGTFRNGVKISH